MYTIGGLCSGVGGIELGFKLAGFNISWANDMDKNCMKTYEAIMGKNHYIDKKPQMIHQIKELPSPVTVLAAGFPCQAFSIAGKRKGFEDARGTVIYDIIKLINMYNKIDMPKVLFLENVKNFKTHDKSNTYNTIVKELNKLDYSVYTKVLNSCDYSDIPQNRERTYMVCFLGEGEWNKKNFEKLPDDIKDVEISKHIDVFPKTAKFHFNYPKKNQKPASLENISTRKRFYEKNVENRYHYNGKYEKMMREAFPDPKEHTGYQIRRVYPRENQSSLIPTLTANMGTGGHNVPLIYQKKTDLWRKLTPKECFRIQGYEEYADKLPDSSSVANGQLYKQAGNSVTVTVVKNLAKSILQTLDE
tara:strand:- start:176 stop:1255 length:1080 start_codon:yes stop_codon:yes gene_type:complete